MSAGDFVLNTESMDDAAESCQKLGDKMKSLKDDLISAETALLSCWSGKGRNEFEKQFRLLKDQLGDITDTLMETGEKILTAEQSYIQADTNAAKLETGVTKGEVSSADDYVENAIKD